MDIITSYKKILNMNNQQEEWKDIPNYPNYEVSNFGKVKSLNYNRTGKPKILKSSINRNGYLRVDLCKEGKGKKHFIHQLVMLSFKGIEPNGMKHTIDHIDGDKTNNHIDNLEVVSSRENTSRYYSNRKTSSKYTGVSFNKRSNKYETKIRIDGKLYNLGYSTNDCECWIYYVRVLDYLNNNTNEETVRYIKSKEYKII